MKSSRTETAHNKKWNSKQVVMGMMRLKILDVDRNTVFVNAFIDEGSDSTLLRQEFANTDKIFGIRQILKVEGACGVVTQYRSHGIKFQIRTNCNETLNLTGSTPPTTVVSATPVTDWVVLKQRWSHILPSGRRYWW
jgi:hypothetical protein